MILRDLSQKTTTQLFAGFVVTSPRFAPKGLRFAAFTRPLSPGNSKLVLHTVGESGSVESVLNTKANVPASGRDLRWSPSGRYIAGVVMHNEVARLHVWESDGKELAQLPLPQKPFKVGWNALEYVPTWLPDDKGLTVFFQGENGKIMGKKLTAAELGLQ